jgi:DNA-binding SARP family transcriptional activator
MLMVNVLGSLTITLGAGCHIAKLPKKGSALLAYLAMVGGPVPRERLADLLWPYQATEQARHSLRNCLLELRKRLGPEVARLHCDFDSCRLEAETDLQHFRQLVETGGLDELRKAVWLIRGDLLDGLDITSEPWSEWLDRERELVAGAIGPALTIYSLVASQAGRHDEALSAARQLVWLNNLNEESHRCLMRVLAAAGQRGCALQQFKRLGQVLKAELGVAPDAASCALARELAGKPENEDEAPSRPSRVEAADRLEPTPAAPLPPPQPLRMVIPADLPDDPITLKLDKLVAEIRSWKSGIARLTRPMIEECETTMGSAAGEIRRLQAALRAAIRPPVSEPVAA